MMDMIFCFFSEYMDQETFTYEKRLKKIVIQYLKGSFIFDFAAWFPVELFLKDD